MHFVQQYEVQSTQSCLTVKTFAETRCFVAKLKTVFMQNKCPSSCCLRKQDLPKICLLFSRVGVNTFSFNLQSYKSPNSLLGRQRQSPYSMCDSVSHPLAIGIPTCHPTLYGVAALVTLLAIWTSTSVTQLHGVTALVTYLPLEYKRQSPYSMWGDSISHPLATGTPTSVILL